MHAWQEESGAGGSAFAYLLERAHAVRRAARWAWRYEALGAEEVARAGVRQLAAVADVVVTGGGGAAATLDSAPDPVLRGLNVLLSTFEDENESESEGVEGAAVRANVGQRSRSSRARARLASGPGRAGDDVAGRGSRPTHVLRRARGGEG